MKTKIQRLLNNQLKFCVEHGCRGCYFEKECKADTSLKEKIKELVSNRIHRTNMSFEEALIQTYKNGKTHRRSDGKATLIYYKNASQPYLQYVPHSINEDLNANDWYQVEK